MIDGASLIPVTEREAILERLGNLPPEVWLLADCHTEDQRTHWSNCKLYFLWLKRLLKDYFGGGKEALALDLLPLKQKQFWINERDKYIHLYDIIHYSWGAIRRALEKIELANTAHSPGEMLIKVLEWKAASMFAECHDMTRPALSRLSPQKAYREYQKTLKYKSPEEAIANLSKDHLRLDAYRGFCLIVAEQEARKDSLLRRKLSAYYRAYNDVQSDLYAQINPRKKNEPGHQWVNGHKEPLTKKK